MTHRNVETCRRANRCIELEFFPGEWLPLPLTEDAPEDEVIRYLSRIFGQPTDVRWTDYIGG